MEYFKINFNERTSFQRSSFNPATYTNAWDGPPTPEGVLARQRLWKIFSKHKVFDGAERVLDMACGKGTLLKFMKGEVKHITEFDLSDEMLRYAKQEAVDLGMESNVEIIQGNGQNTNLQTNDFDLVLAFNCFPHFLNKAKTISDWSRLLKVDGHLAIIHSMNRKKLNDMHARRGFDVTQDTLPSRLEMFELLHQAGLVIVDYVDQQENDYYLMKAKKRKIYE